MNVLRFEDCVEETTTSGLKSKDLHRFIFVRSYDDRKATVRLQSEPLLRGLRSRNTFEVELYSPKNLNLIKSDTSSCILFHYDDHKAAQLIRASRKQPNETLVVCFASDLYSFSFYRNIHDIVDLFIVPSQAHRDVLCCGIYKPVYVLPESIDPISSIEVEESNRRAYSIGVDTDKISAAWFGNSESFYKGMATLIPVINNKLASGHLANFSLIANLDGGLSRYGFPIIEFSNKTFRACMENFDYAILSHFPLDLQMNSVLKSSNKAITALFSGVIPILSNTSNYKLLYERFGLRDFLFSSPADLDSVLQRLNPVMDAKKLEQSGIFSILRAELTEERLTESFLAILIDYVSKLSTLPSALGLPPLVKPPPRGLKSQLAEFIPNIGRAAGRLAQRHQ